MSKILYGLDPQEYEHPLDREALNALQKISGIQALYQKFEGSTIEKATLLNYKGNKLKINKNNFSKIFDLYQQALKILDFAEFPDLYTSWDYQVKASAYGVEKPSVWISSGAVDILDEEELMFVLGHELGHIKSGHSFYYSLSRRFLPLIVNNIPVPNIPILGDLLVQSIQYPLYHWSRMQELSCDRAGLLCCQNKEAALRAIIKLAGVPLKNQGDDYLNDFIEQSREFIEDDFETTDTMIKKFSQAYSFDHAIIQGRLVPQTHPFPMLRIGKLIEWIESGQYEQLFSKDREKMKIIYCSKCGEIIDIEENFCGFCGAIIEKN